MPSAELGPAENLPRELDLGQRLAASSDFCVFSLRGISDNDCPELRVEGLCLLANANATCFRQRHPDRDSGPVRVFTPVLSVKGTRAEEPLHLA